MLVPEINLTPQLEQRIVAALPGRRMATLHSRLAAGERRRAWTAAATGECDLVLGTRLSVFAPMPRLALIVVDEEHDPSFKQQDGVRYHGRDVAIWRAHQRNVPIVLGSATPSLETLVHAQRGRYGWRSWHNVR
jgi:primosomal protein N' (replication factor Y)